MQSLDRCKELGNLPVVGGGVLRVEETPKLTPSIYPIVFIEGVHYQNHRKDGQVQLWSLAVN
jgi:hypothetical protein